jgi:hypothetical protein
VTLYPEVRQDAPLQVALLGIHIDLSGNHDLIGPGMIAITAILAAIIAARTANRRQAAQLQHDRELQSELQSERLAYDREQRDRQHIRDTIDEALRGVDAAIRTLAEYEAKIVVGDDQRSERRRALNGEDKASPMQLTEAVKKLQEETADIHTSSQATYDAAIDLTSMNLRLGVRLGKDHPIVKSHQAFRDVYSTRSESLRPLPNRPLTDDDQTQIRSAVDSTNAILTAFFSECRKWFEG